MPRKGMIQAILYGFIFLLFFQVFSVQLAYGNVEDVDSEKQQISKVEPSDSKEHDPDAGGGDVPWWKVIWNKAKEIGQDGLDIISDLGSTISTEWNEFLTDLENSWVGDAWDTATDWLNDAWDWIKETEWIQTIVASILATALIVVAIIVIVGTAPAWGVIAIIGAAALGAGFLYQWIAGDNYSFLGAFGSSLIGGILGYVGYTTGAFATAWLWLRNTAGPAAWNWIRNTAFPWVVGKGRAALTWGRTVAWPWLRGKGIAAWNWVKTRPVWAEIASYYRVPNVWGYIFKGARIGFFAGGISSLIGSLAGYLLEGETLSIKELFIDTAIGAFSGALLGPILIPVQALSWTLIGGLGLYGGLENFLGDGIKKGEWSFNNFIVGAVITVSSIKLLGPLVSRFINGDISSESTAKSVEEVAKKILEKVQNGGENSNNSNKPDIPTENKNTGNSPPDNIEPELEGPNNDKQILPDDQPTSELNPNANNQPQNQTPLEPNHDANTQPEGKIYNKNGSTSPTLNPM